jgi:MFS family permease
MAQQVLVYRLTGSAAALGIVSIIGFIPILPLSLWGGSIADRFSKRWVILAAQVVMLVQAFVLAWLTWSGSVTIWQVYVMSFILGAAQAIDVPARQSFTVEMVEGKEDLTNAIGLNSAIFNGARAIGPAMAGLVVAATGEGIAFFINGLSFVAVIISLLMMRNLPGPAFEVKKQVSTVSHMQEGVRYVFKTKLILVLISLVAVSAFLSMPYTTLMPVFASNILRESAQPVMNYFCNGATPLMHCQSPEALPLGLLLAMMGVGAVVGALTVASLGEQSRRGRLLTIGNLAFPSLLILFAFSRSFLFSSFVLFLIGFCFVCQNALANTLLQLITPDEMRGRVMSVYTMVFQGMNRLGSMQAGYTADWIGAAFSVGIGAVISLLFGAVVAVCYPRVRQM